MGEVTPSDDPRDVGGAKRVLRLAVDLRRIVRAEPEPHYIKFPGKIRNGLGFRPLLVRCKEGRIEMVVPNLEKHVVPPLVKWMKTPNLNATDLRIGLHKTREQQVSAAYAGSAVGDGADLFQCVVTCK